ncbi:MAG: stage II sporulation protein R [Clostridium sp.]|nr:stage II sporulation protein R [Clostridium sp.]
MKRSVYNMKHLKQWKLPLLKAIAPFFFVTALLLAFTYARLLQEAQAARLSPDILRFHVLANSNSPEDQALKLEVRDFLIDMVYRELCAEADVSSLTERRFSKEMISDFIMRHHTSLERAAENYMFSKGFPYSATVRLERRYFPTRQYGDVTLPCGSYDAVRVLLGRGTGKNWWCVLYPPLCFSGIASSGEMPPDSKEELKALVPEDERSSLFGAKTLIFGERELELEQKAAASDVRVKFWLAEVLGQKETP